jgi:hypothetical protein
MAGGERTVASLVATVAAVSSEQGPPGPEDRTPVPRPVPSVPGPPTDPRDLRCSDADRDLVAEALRLAAGDGRLTLDELDERLDAAYSARTYRDLEPVLADLPGARPPGPRGSSLPVPLASTPPAVPAPGKGLARVGGTSTSDSAVAIFAETTRSGAWVVPEQFASVAVFGSVELDLREARLASQQVVIQANAVMGSVVVYVPDDVTVSCGGNGVMGEYSGPHEAATPGAPHVTVTGIALMGSVEVKRKAPKKWRLPGRGEA